MSGKIFEKAVILTGRDLEPVEGYMRVRDGVIEEIREGDPPESGVDLNGSFIMPPFVNAHTHLGDSVCRGIYQNRAQADVVGGGGVKFKALSGSSDREKIEAMGESLRMMRGSGTLAHLDFRENGVEGTRLLRNAKDELVRSIILSRPTSEEDFEELLRKSDGVGLPSLDFLPSEDLDRLSERVSGAGKLLSFHVSETREAHEGSLKARGETEIDRALEFDPSFLVHGTWATRGDLQSLSREGMPLVLCPRANSLLSVGIPPIHQALEEGVRLWLGTDNVCVSPPDMLRELSFAWAMLRLQSEGVGSSEARELLKAATVNPAIDLNLDFGPLEEGGRASFLVLSRDENLRRCGDPYEAIVNRARTGDIRGVHGHRPDG